MLFFFLCFSPVATGEVDEAAAAAAAVCRCLALAPSGGAGRDGFGLCQGTYIYIGTCLHTGLHTSVRCTQYTGEDTTGQDRTVSA